MCGIIGRVSTNLNPVKSVKGLKFLEYRGYDSYGIYMFNTNNQSEYFQKNTGALPEEDISKLSEIESNIEVAHTRWATHGGVTKNNAHPHFDSKKEFYVVMNGIIENYLDIKSKELREVEFLSETDTEILPHLFAKYFNGSLIDTTNIILDKLKGEFSFIVKYKNQILAYKNINPIICGINDSEIFLSSDMNFLQNNTKKYYVCNDNDVVLATFDNDEVYYELFEDFSKKEFKWIDSKKSDLDVDNSYSTYMEKEIYDQKYLRNLITSENLSAIKYLKNSVLNKKLVLSAAGTSFHAAYVMHYKLLKLGINSQVIVASELNNYLKVIKNSLIVVFSQSGETADLIHPLKNLRDENEIFTITNTANSTLDRFASRSIHLNCGREISVASTKAFSFQVFVSSLLVQELTGNNALLNLDKYENEFDKIIEDNLDSIYEICERFVNTHTFFFIGRDENHPFALEGALKLKEITYVNAQGYAGGELKHGTLALIEEGIPVVVIGDSDEIISNAIEIKTRGGIIIGVSSNNHEVFDYHLKSNNYYEEIFSTVLLQFFALKMTEKLGLNPDKPRNLAKSVTVK